MKKNISTVFMIIICGLTYPQNEKELLTEISNKINTIKNASYTVNSSCGEPNDTTFFNSSSKMEIYTRKNDDNFLRSNFYYALSDEPEKIIESYTNGTVRRIDWDKKEIRIDSLNNDFFPYKMVLGPILIGIQGIVDYSIANFSNVKIDIMDTDDTTVVKLSFPNKIIEMINYIPWIVECSKIDYDNVMASYTLWIDNNYIPFKILREVHTERCLLEIENLLYDTLANNNLLSGLYYPENFSVIDSKNIPVINSHILENMKAPEWILEVPGQDTEVSLFGIKSDIILLQFTGMGCGHCKESIPFLKQLRTDYKESSLKIISIETFVNNDDKILHYLELLGVNYQYLKGTDETKRMYEVDGVPAFFIINQNRVIEKTYIGYREGVTDKEILIQINELINDVSANNNVQR